MATSQRKGMRMPLAKPILRCDRHLQLIVGGTYGYTRAVKNIKKFHGGVDLYAEPGTDCFAIYYGSVKSILKGKDFGNFVITTIDFPEWTCWGVYAHLSKVLVSRGTQLEPGTIIGQTGTSGNSSPHFRTFISRSGGHLRPANWARGRSIGSTRWWYSVQFHSSRLPPK